jgi:hypothetical protein
LISLGAAKTLCNDIFCNLACFFGAIVTSVEESEAEILFCDGYSKVQRSTGKNNFHTKPERPFG